MRRVTRRQILKVVSAVLPGGISGCGSVGRDSSATLDSTDEPAGTETATIPTENRELPAIIIRNETDQPRTLTLRVVPDGGTATTTTDSWDVSPNSNREVGSYPPLESDATVTATVEGYDPVSYDWTGGGGGALHVAIDLDELSIEPIVT